MQVSATCRADKKDGLSVIGFKREGTGFRRECHGVATASGAPENSLVGSRRKVEPFAVMRPARRYRIRDIGDQFARQAFQDVDNVDFWRTGLPGIKCQLLAIGGPARRSGFELLLSDMRTRFVPSASLIQISVGAATIRGKCDVLAVRRVLDIILLVRGRKQLCRSGFGAPQILAPNVDMKSGERIRDPVTSGGDVWIRCAFAKGKFSKRAVRKCNFIQLEIVTKMGTRDDQPLVVGRPRYTAARGPSQP